MMEIFENEKQLETWLEKQPKDVYAIIALRCALRVLPVSYGRKAEDEKGEIVLNSCWKLLCAQEYCLNNFEAKSEIKKAIYNKYSTSAVASTFASTFAIGASTSDFAADLAAAIASSAAVTATSGSTAANAFVVASAAATILGINRTTIFNAISIDTDTPSFTMPLWPVYNPIADAHDELLSFFDKDPQVWGYFKDWYLGHYNGEPLDTDFAAKVAQIKPEIWESGAKVVAAEIEKLQAQDILDRLPQVDEIYQTDDGLFNVRPAEFNPEDILKTALRQVQFSFDLCIGSNQCSMNNLCMAAKYIQHTLNDCADDPNAIEQNFRIASGMIENNIKNGEYVSDDGLTALQSNLDEQALNMRAHHPAVSEAAQKRTEQKLKEIGQDKKLEIAQRIEIITDTATFGRLQTEMKLDGITLGGQGGAAPQARAVKRLSERIARMSLMQKIRRLNNSGSVLVLRISKEISELLSFLKDLLM